MFKPSLGKCNQKSLGQGLGIWCLWWALCCGFHLFWGGGFILLWISIGHVVLQTAAKSSHSTSLNFGSGFTSEYKPWEVSPCYPKFMDLHQTWVSLLVSEWSPWQEKPLSKWPVSFPWVLYEIHQALTAAVPFSWEQGACHFHNFLSFFSCLPPPLWLHTSISTMSLWTYLLSD